MSFLCLFWLLVTNVTKAFVYLFFLYDFFQNTKKKALLMFLIKKSLFLSFV